MNRQNLPDDPHIDYLVNEIGLSLYDIQTTTDVLGFTPETQVAMATDAMRMYGLTPEQYRERLREQFPEVYSLFVPRDYTDTGNAELVERRNRGKMLFTDSLGWMVYNEKTGTWEANDHTAKDKCREYTNHLLSVAQEQYREACDNALAEKLSKDKEKGKDSGKVKDPPEKALYQHAMRSRSARSLWAMLEVCKTRMNGKAALFDANPYDLNTPAGVVDLRTGEIRPHEPEAYCTYTTTCAPSQEGMELWKKYLDIITCGNRELADYLQIVVGMSIIGKITQEFAVFCIGTGRNGKSTFYGACSLVLGDYSGTLATDVMLKGTRENRFAYANIRGKRLIVCPEFEENKTLSTEQLKKLSSAEDPIDFERKGKDLERLPRTFHLHLFSNNLPKVDSIDEGAWRRIRVIPFNAIMPEGEKEILNYASEVLYPQAGGAILQWMIDGATKAYKCGFNFTDPQVVKEATKVYRSAEDWMQNFIEDECIVDRTNVKLRTQMQDLRKAWANYARVYMYQNRSDAELTAAMTAKGFSKITGHGNKVYWVGIGLKAKEIVPPLPYQN